jgi:uncharacterized membrane protein YoaK (UPF0700 family)
MKLLRSRRDYIVAALIFMVGVVLGAVAMLKIEGRNGHTFTAPRSSRR